MINRVLSIPFKNFKIKKLKPARLTFKSTMSFKSLIKKIIYFPGTLNWKRDDMGSIYIRSTKLDVGIRVDTDGMMLITVSKDSSLATNNDISGICGNMNGNPDSTSLKHILTRHLTLRKIDI